MRDEVGTGRTKAVARIRRLTGPIAARLGASTSAGTATDQPTSPLHPLRDDPARQPLRADPWLGLGLRAAGEALARDPVGNVPELLAGDMLKRLTENRRAIRQAYLSTLEAAREGHIVTPAAEWLIDNQHIIDEAFRLQRDALGPNFLRHLPMLALPGGERVPRVQALAHGFIAMTNSDIMIAPLTEAVEGFQSVETLTIAELWALPAFLRFMLLENLRRLSDIVVDARQSRQAADALADALNRSATAASHRGLLDEAEPRLADPTFAMQLSYRLSEAAQMDDRAEAWLHRGLSSHGTALEKIVQGEYARQSATNVSVGNIVRSLRRMGDINWLNWFEEVSRVDAILRDGSDFGRLDQPTRAAYRDAIETVARRSRHSETEVATAAVAAAGHADAIGEVLIGTGLGAFKRSQSYRPPLREQLRRGYRRLGWMGIGLPMLLATVLLLMVAGAMLPDGGMRGLGVVLLVLAAFTAMEAGMGLTSLIATKLVAPRRLPSYDFRTGVPSSHRTLVVIPCMLGSKETIDELVQQLELHYLANPLGDVSFALLTDWRDALTETLPDDDELLAHAEAGIERMADLYDHGGRRRFFLMHRKRLWNPSEGRWMGWERKRGKLDEMNRLLRGGTGLSFIPTGPLPPEGIRLVITLDSDTRLPRQTVAQLVGKLAHPVNRPEIDPARRAVGRGHAILQPRISASLTTGAEASLFQRVFSVSRGLDPYVFAVSDLYQDLLDEGSFTGKGIYDLDQFEAVTRDRFPENMVLSHDLIEGSLARAALVSDVEMVEEFPIRYRVERGRQHRWTRGDWQLLPFIVGRGNGLNGLARFKMVDNLRRSLVAPTWVAASAIGWLALPWHAALVWQLALVGLVALMPVIHMLLGLRTGSANVAMGYHIRRVGHDFGKFLLELGLRFSLMADNAVNMVDAIARTIYRMTVSRQHLLEWTTASDAARKAANSRQASAYVGMMRGAMVLAAVLALAVIVINPAAFLVAAPFLLAWLASPWIAAGVSRTMETEDRLDLEPEDGRALRQIGRQTWRYFEEFVGPATNHLPPDNYQDDPAPKLAERTSPTNIGFYLLSVLSANDLGWIGRADAIRRVGDTLDTLERLERHGGHFYNWYDTRDLSVMNPAYISSVDSGNLAGTLIALCAGLKMWARDGVGRVKLAGMEDNLALLRSRLALLPDDNRRSMRQVRKRLDDALDHFATLLREAAMGTDALAPRSNGLASSAETVLRLTNEINGEVRSHASAEALAWAQALRRCCESVLGDSAIHADPRALARVLDSLGERARLLAFQMDFRFLIDPEKQLLSVGYRPETEERDQSCYDLLASEARLTSFFAIAKGDLRREHWGHLGRPFAALGRGDAALMSWSGCMFEYLMAPLVMKERLGSILNLSNNTAVKEQIRFGEEHGVPWGVSESAFNARDHDMNYQYYAFGVPTLGLKRVVVDDLVIAPYSSLLASQFRPAEAVRNLDRLAKMGALGPHGFYDAVDFTRARLVEGARYAVVRNVMAHHHGMSIVAVANAVLDGIHRERFHDDPVVQAAELLLQEKAPREIVPVTRAEAGVGLTGGEGRFEQRVQSETIDPANAPRDLALLSNGRFATTLSSTGAGQAMLQSLAVNRWLPDPATNQGGMFLFMRDLDTQEWWSATTSPRRASNGETASTIFSDHKAECFKVAEDIESRMEVIVASDADAEGRRLTLRNRSTRERLIEVTSYGEIVLDDPANDRAHPAFSKMFVRTRIGEDGCSIFARRRPRDPKGKNWYLAHVMTGDDAAIMPGCEAETDRRAFIGRGRGLGRARAFDPGAKLQGNQGFTLDPIFALRRVVRLAPRQQVDLTFWTIIGDNEENLLRAAQHYALPRTYDHELQLAWSYSQVQLRHLDVSMADATLFRRFAALLVYPDPSLAAADLDRRGALGMQSDLWPLGISGDDPIILARIDDESDLPILRGAIRMHRYLRARGIRCDLVVLNERSVSYVQDLQTQIDVICDASAHFAGSEEQAKHLFRLRRDAMSAQSLATLIAAARIVLHTRNGRLADQIARLDERRAAAQDAGNRSQAPLPLAPARPRPKPRALAETTGEGLEFWNGYGGFDPSGREYVVRLRHGEATPHPWINVIAKDSFGFHVSAGGGGYTWAVNSRDYQVTPWSNDPVVNRLGEAFHILDRDNGKLATPFVKLSDDPNAVFEARHGMGWSKFTGTTDWLQVEAVQTLADGQPAKLTRLRLTNRSGRRLRLQVSAYAELVLGQHRAKTATSLRAGFDADQNAILARNPFETAITGRVAGLAADRPADGWLVSRLTWLGRGGAMMRPAAVLNWPRPQTPVPPAFAADTNGDPCAALMCQIDIPAGGSDEITFALADAPAAEIGAVLSGALGPDAAERGLAAAAADWDETLGALQVETPDRKLDLMVNAWLPYQALGCRLRARTAFYQASGAFGFRDQLQDTLALMLQDPGLARAQLLNAGRRQFRQGDFQHWWLPGTGAGVRTMIVDDPVWLAYGTASYIGATGDTGILDEPLPWLEGPQLNPGEHDRFFTPDVSTDTAPLYDHCAAGLELCMARTGPHGLPLFLGGDWNDGMNRVGEGGTGESGWMGWFLIAAIDLFAPIAEARGEGERAARLRAHRDKVAAAMEADGWDGGWYRRGWYDNGQPLGSHESDECRIDSIAQSWGMISGAAQPERAKAAADAAIEHLFDPEAKILKLFTPPFDETPNEPGYIKSYPPGVRENGGQYTHAASWMVYALAGAGRGDVAHRLFDAINPVSHATARADADRYRVEPYVVAADVYAAPERTGQGGWTWYTGSAGWLYRAAVEGILGLRLVGGEVRVDPNLPPDWDGYRATLRRPGHPEQVITVRRAADGSVTVEGAASGPVA